jgi:hypothetical protein
VVSGAERYEGRVPLRQNALNSGFHGAADMRGGRGHEAASAGKM